ASPRVTRVGPSSTPKRRTEMFTRPGVEPTPTNRSDWRKSSTACSDSNVYTPPKIPSARSASQTFEASPGTAAKAGASSSHELANSSSESPSRLKFTIRICTATSLVRARGPQDDDDVSAVGADEDLMRIGFPWSTDVPWVAGNRVM